MQVAFVTYDKIPNLSDDDKLLAAYFLKKQIVVTPAIWDDASVDWQQFDVIILRSTWDYFTRPVEFNQWLDKMEQTGCKVFNPLPVVKWNQNKQYFDDLKEKGISLPPYVICSVNDAGSLTNILQAQGWHKAVVKPAISGGAYHTWVTDIDRAGADEERFAELLKNGNVIVQQFAAEVISNGELSLLFFNKKFSHAVCKKAKAGDFRVQEQFGGITTATTIDPEVLQEATAIVDSIDEPLLYARVDGVMTPDGRFLLMELELIEPSLFLSTNAQACENFYIAFAELVAPVA